MGKQNQKELEFVHLRMQSHYSLGRSICRIPDLVDACREHGMPASRYLLIDAGTDAKGALDALLRVRNAYMEQVFSMSVP